MKELGTESQDLETKEPVEQSTEENTEVKATEEAVDDGAEETTTEEKPKKVSGYKGKWQREQAKAQYLEQRLQELESKQTVKTDVQLEKPKRDDPKFQSESDYLEAYADWKFEQKEKDLESKRVKEDQQKSAQTVQSTHLKRVEEFKKTAADFDEVMDDFDEEHPDFKMSPHLAKLAMESDLGPAALYELAKNPELALKINALEPLAAAKEFGKLEAKLQKPIAKKSTAPPPPKPISGTKQQVSKDPFEEGIPFSEYNRRRDEQEAQKRAKRA